jgi:hypothetical protein
MRPELTPRTRSRTLTCRSPPDNPSRIGRTRPPTASGPPVVPEDGRADLRDQVGGVAARFHGARDLRLTPRTCGLASLQAEASLVACADAAVVDMTCSCVGRAVPRWSPTHRRTSWPLTPQVSAIPRRRKRPCHSSGGFTGSPRSTSSRPGVHRADPEPTNSSADRILEGCRAPRSGVRRVLPGSCLGAPRAGPRDHRRA